MNICLSTTGLMRRLQRLLAVLVFSFFSFQQVHAAPVVVSVDHRVAVTYSAFQFDASTGVYTTQVRIRNRSSTSILSPLRLTFDQDALKEVRLLNARGVGKDGQPYFEFALPKGMLAARSVTEPTKVVFTFEKNGGRHEGDKRDEKEKAKDNDKGKGAAKGAEPKEARSLFVSAQRASAAVELAPLKPRAEPYTLTVGSGKVKVRFSVALVGKTEPSTTVYLRRSGDRKGIAMNDKGKDGDLLAKDGIYGMNVAINTSSMKPDSCVGYEAFINSGRSEVVSPAFGLCVSSFPVQVAPSNTADFVMMTNGTKAVADEILFIPTPHANVAMIRRLATDIHATVVGSIPPLNLYQLKLVSPASSSRLLALLTQLNARAEVKAASVNAIGTYAYKPSDTLFPSTSVPNQHGLRLVIAHVDATDANAWDAGAIGNGVTVVVLDSGLDRTHPDFGTTGDCQLAENDCGAANTDLLGHGTQVAGVVAAKTNNGLDVAGVAYGSKIHSIIVSPDLAVADTEMLTGFNAAASYVASNGTASVINASFSLLNAFANWPVVCAAIDSVVLNGVTPRAVVVNAVGNNGANNYYYPARCNDLYTAIGHRADLLVTVANSASVVDSTCGSVGVDQRCSTSNYGAWVDIAAPGSAIISTALGGSYVSQTGTSFSAPMVSGAAAILKSCGVLPDQIESTLISSANVSIPFPATISPPILPGGTTPRLDIHRAMSYRPPTAVSLSGGSLNENTDTTLGVEVGTLLTTDIDTCDRHTYSIVGGADAAVFSIGGSSADRLRIAAGVLDYETKSSYAVTVRVTDFGGQTFDQALVVNVIDVNEAPVAVVLSNTVTSTPENGGNIKVADIAISDDALGTNVLSLSGADAASFSLAGNALHFNGGADFETKSTYSVTVNADDAGVGATPDASQNFTLAITNVNEAPTAVVLSNTVTSTPENGGNIKVADIAISDDALGTNVLSLAGADAGSFTIVGNALHYNGGADFETKSTCNVTVNVDDAGAGGSPDATQNFTLAITNVNETPSIANQTFNINENWNNSMPNGTIVGTVAANDPDNGDTLNYVITTGNVSSAFSIDPGTGVISVNNNAALNFEVTPNFNLTVQVTDAGIDGGALSASATIAVILTNDPNDNGDPHITAIDGLHYDFQSAGEYVALRGANGMEIQTRQTPVSTASSITDGYSGLTSGVSVNTAVAARVGQHRVTFQPNISGNPASSGLELRVDGVLTILPANGLDLGSGGRVVPSLGGGIQIDFPDRTTMIATAGWWAPHNLWYLNIAVFHTPAREGIMGARVKGSWLPKLSDGTVLGPRPAALHDRYVDLYEKFADSWRVSDKTSLFDYAKDTSTKTFTFAEWPKENPPYVIPQGGKVAKPVKRQVAQRACRGVVGKNANADCVFDVMVTGNPGFAKTYSLSQKIRAGSTAIMVRDDKDPSMPKESVTFTATVARNATITRRESGGKGAPSGTVQFTLDGTRIGVPIKLDSKGQARWKVASLKVGKHKIAARYIPAKGSAFLASSSHDESHSVTDKY